MYLPSKDKNGCYSDSRRTSGSTRHPSVEEKMQMALSALRGEGVTEIARRFQVSRKCVYVQKARAIAAIETDFLGKSSTDAAVIFTVSFTHGLVERLVLAMYMCGKSSYRAIQRIFEDIFEFYISLGKLSLIVKSVAKVAAKVNGSYDVSRVSVACHDEFFHDNKPYVVAVEPQSRFCFLLESTPSPLDDIWTKALQSLRDRGYKPEYVTADGGGSLRNALCQIFPGTPCFYDVFHLVRYFGQAILAMKRDMAIQEIYRNNSLQRVQYADSKGYIDLDAVIQLEKSENRLAAHLANINQIRRCIGRMLFKTANAKVRISAEERLANYRKTEAIVFDTCQAYDWLEAKSHKPLLNLTSILSGQRGNILGLYEHKGRAPLVRASSMVENFNNSLRQQTRRFSHLDNDFRELALFYLNHQRFLVSKNRDRKGRSPAELFLGHELPSWLDALSETPPTKWMTAARTNSPES